ncbi:hypothetical protein [Streptomyces sp. NPDC088270]|uniref:hypothetical protein n=1 Tax=unclassified Streptomyces TaxID=2593676 RepID=UPI0034148810
MLSLEEIRHAVREVLVEELAPLAGVRDDVRAQLDEAKKESCAELTALREEVAGLRAELERRAAGEAAAVEVTEEHSALLREAARVSSATVLCHRDAWEFLTAHAGRQPHFRVPAQVLDKGEERVRAALSGRSLIALLIALHSVRETAIEGDGDQEFATALYERVRESLSGLTAVGRPVTITLDDRVSPDDSTLAGSSDTPSVEPGNASDAPQDAPGTSEQPGDEKE